MPLCFFAKEGPISIKSPIATRNILMRFVRAAGGFLSNQ